MWDGINKASVIGRGKYLKGGFLGVVEIVKTLAMTTRNKGDVFIVEFKIVETNMPEEHPVGGKFSWFQKMIDKDTAFSNVVGWAAACLGYTDEKEIEEDVIPNLQEIMEEATDNPEKNDFIGVKVRVETYQTTTKAGKDFTRYDWSPAEQD